MLKLVANAMKDPIRKVWDRALDVGAADGLHQTPITNYAALVDEELERLTRADVEREIEPSLELEVAAQEAAERVRLAKDELDIMRARPMDFGRRVLVGLGAAVPVAVAVYAWEGSAPVAACLLLALGALAVCLAPTGRCWLAERVLRRGKWQELRARTRHRLAKARAAATEQEVARRLPERRSTVNHLYAYGCRKGDHLIGELIRGSASPKQPEPDAVDRAARDPRDARRTNGSRPWSGGA